MGILNGFTNALGGLGGGQRRKGYPKTLQASNFQSTGHVAVITTDYTKIGEYTIPAQNEINVGYGSANQAENQGYIYVDINVGGVGGTEGMLRIMVANANETRVVKVFEERTDVLSGSVTAKDSKVPLPEKFIAGEFGRTPREDDRIQLWLMADTAGNWYATYSTIYIPVTVYQ